MSTDGPAHPDWMAVGAHVTVRRMSVMGRIVHEYVGLVTRHTPNGVVVDNGLRYVKKDGRYVETPRYLDYTTVLAPTPEETP